MEATTMASGYTGMTEDAVTTMMAMTTTTPAVMDDDMTTAQPNAPIFILKQISGDIPEFQMILPCIFGIFIILSLGLMVFYTKNPEEDASHKLKHMDGKKSNGKVENWF